MLWRLRQADRTVVLYTSDHGDMLGSHGILMKSVMYDASARVPMVMRGPDIGADATCSVPVSLVDVFPTILAATGSKPSEADADLPGDSLVDLAGRSDDGGRVVLSEYHGPLSSAASYLIRRGRWKYVAHMLDDAPPQLFDVTVDPDELDDRASDPGLADVRASLDAELREILDPEATDEQIRASQRGASEGATLGRPKARVGPIPATDTGAIAVGLDGAAARDRVALSGYLRDSDSLQPAKKPKARSHRRESNAVTNNGGLFRFV
ncbi:MAG: sulfatase-like hydrolase/transferase, partial [Rhodococcus sp.]|nr:sulfatase-like hydrolase/transferase [Rhodococcus sp. (in: high G+C Gram-positive bacteria)]